MIDKIIENWLTKSSEKSYQLPFCNLLRNEGYTILHLTRHCAMEYGKDIIAIAPDGSPTVFQLKDVNGKKYKLKDFQQEVGQLTTMIMVPLNHPSLETTGQHQSFLVVNGEIEEEVFNAIHTMNSNWEKQGLPFKLKTIVKGEIIQKAINFKDNFLPTEVNEFKLLLEFQLDDGTGLLNKAKFALLLESIFEKKADSVNEARRIISSGALLCSFALSSYIERHNYFALIEGWTILIAYTLGFAEKNNIAFRDLSIELNLAEKIIENNLLDIYDEIKSRNNLINEFPQQDAFIHKHRTVMFLGMVSYLGILKKYDTQVDINLEKIQNLYKQFGNFNFVWGESAVPYFLTMAWCRYSFNEIFGKQDILTVFQLFLETVNNTENVFPNYYYDVEQAIIMWHDPLSPGASEALNDRTSRILETLVHLNAVSESKQVLQDRWNEITEFYLTEFRPIDKTDFYKWHIDKGVEHTKPPFAGKTWNSLIAESSVIDISLLPNYLMLMPKFVPLFLMVYPHRFQRDLVLFFHQHHKNYRGGS